MRIIFIIILLNLISNVGFAKQKSTTDVDFTSDSIEVIENEDLMIATGNVLIKSQNRSIKADQVKYYKRLDKAIATGNVIIEELDGSIFETDKVTLTEEFKAITVVPLFGKFKDKSHIKADSLVKKADGTSFFNNGTYTACDCDWKNDDEPPLWELSSEEIKRDKKTQTIYYKNVTMKLFSFPIFYFAYFEHPDWTVRRRSGILTPSFGYSDRNGFQSSIPYYIATEDQTWDMTITNHFKGKSGYANQLNFRKFFNESELEGNVYQGELNTEKKNNDGVFAANVDFGTRLASNWNIEASGKYTEQETFMRRYGFDGENHYKLFLKAEKVKENKISEIEIYDIENLSSDSNAAINEPLLAPNIYHHAFKKDKNTFYETKINLHDIKGDEGYDVQRWSGSYKLGKLLTNNNYEFKLDAETGIDLYAINGRPYSDESIKKNIKRFSLGYAISAEKEIIQSDLSSSVFLKPKVQFSAMHSTNTKDDVPNRDSSDFRLDDSNLFYVNQYQGRDNIQSNQRVNYGFDNLISSEEFGEIDFFVGQSYRVSGTEHNTIRKNINRHSDIINKLNWQIDEKTSINWSSLIDQSSFERNYSSLTFSKETSVFNFSTTHSSLDGDLVTGNEDREELNFNLTKKYDNNWTIGYTSTYDLSNTNSEKTTEEISLDYVGEYMFKNCLSINLSYKNNSGSADRDITPENSIYLTFSFRNLGDLGL